MAPTNSASASVVVEDVESDDDGELYTVKEQMYRNSSLNFHNPSDPELVDVFPRRRGNVVPPPRLADDAPDYIEEDEEGVITVVLKRMDVNTRVTTETLMSMYMEDATHFSKCVGPIALIAELLKVPKESIALELKPEQLASWDWNKKPLEVGALNGRWTDLMHAVRKAIDENRTLQSAASRMRVPKLKAWRYFIRLWRQGRNYYAFFQQIMPGASFDQIETAMLENLGLCESHAAVEERLAVLLEEFRDRKNSSSRAARDGSEAGTPAATTRTTRTNGGSTATSTTSTNGASSTAQTTASTEQTTDAPTTERRQSSRAKRAPAIYGGVGTEDGGGKRQAKSNSRSGTTTSTTPTNPPTNPPTAGTNVNPPSMVETQDGVVGYTDPSPEWVANAKEKIVLLKNLGNTCSLVGIRGDRTIVDCTIDDLMGGDGAYDRAFVSLLATVILDQLSEPDQALFGILNGFKNAGYLHPQSIVDAGAAALKEITKAHDRLLNTGWITKLCKALIDKHDSMVPVTVDELLQLKVKEITPTLAHSYVQDVFGAFYGPTIDDYYGIRMVIALELVDIGQYHSEKLQVKSSDVSAVHVQHSLMTWLPQQEWKNFRALLVSTAQMILETGRISAIKTIIRKKFVTEDKLKLLAMVDSIEKYFDVADQ